MVALIVVLALGARAGVARADGDPASDVLVSQVAFLPADAGVSPAQQARLGSLLHAAAHAGYPVRVAIIPSAYDLGSITVLWRKPETYARFLGAELGLVYRHPVVVIMPDGVGLNWPGHSVASARREVAAVPVGQGSAGLLQSAETAVRRLLSTAGVHVSSPVPATAAAPASRPRGGGATLRSSGPSPAVIVLGALALVVAAGLGARLAWPRVRGRRWWLAPAAACGIVAAVGAPIAIVSALRGSPAGASPTRTVVGTPYMLPEGRQRAPEFQLRDQNGAPISPASFRGRDVLITFVDPLCRNLCPLEAHVLNALVDRLPTRQRPAVIAVSVDVYADTRHDLMQDFREWSLVPQWHWAVGTRAELASVWKRYAVDVQVVTKRLAGTTVHYITHTEQSILIDPAGYERALFAWPFSPQDVLATLRRISLA